MSRDQEGAKCVGGTEPLPLPSSPAASNAAAAEAYKRCIGLLHYSIPSPRAAGDQRYWWVQHQRRMQKRKTNVQKGDRGTIGQLRQYTHTHTHAHEQKHMCAEVCWRM